MIWLIAAIGMWGVAHSWLASLGLKGTVVRIFGERVARGYRLAYNLFSIVTLLPIYVLLRLLPDWPLYTVGQPWFVLMRASQAASAIGLLVAIRQTDAPALLGLKQLMGGEESTNLVTDGFYRYVRHPMYLFGLLTIWLTPVMTVNTLITSIGLTLYLFIGAYFEEKKLARIFGAEYSQYKARTPMIIPLPWQVAR